MGSYKFPDPNREKKKKIKRGKVGGKRESCRGEGENSQRQDTKNITFCFYLYLSTTEKQSKFYKVSFQYPSLYFYRVNWHL